MKKVVKEYAFISKIEVSDINKSVLWYENLGFERDTRYDVKDVWTQMTMGIPNTVIGLSQVSKETKPKGTGGGVLTFVVENIHETVKKLEKLKISVSGIYSYKVSETKEVLMAFFNDPDNNTLGIRENRNILISGNTEDEYAFPPLSEFTL
jgi:predicted lactoylglutathione lyase